MMRAPLSAAYRIACPNTSGETESPLPACPLSLSSCSLTRSGRMRTPGASPWKPMPLTRCPAIRLATAVPCEAQSKFPPAVLRRKS